MRQETKTGDVKYYSRHDIRDMRQETSDKYNLFQVMDENIFEK